MTGNLTAALAYAQRGWLVGPTDWRAGNHAKAPFTASGHLDFTTAPAAITAWWTRWPLALVGVRVPTTVIVLDFDTVTVEDFQVAYGRSLPETPTVKTGRAGGHGRHVYFRRPDRPLSASRLPGVDLKTHSGYVIAPPSRHPDTGDRYEWLTIGQPAEVPPWLLTLLTPPGPVLVAPAKRGGPLRRWDGLLREVADAPDGQQNFRVFWAAKRAAAEGAPDEWFRELADVAINANHPPARVRRAIDSGRRQAVA